MNDVIYGIHAVSEALKSRERRFDYVAVSRDRTDPRMQRIIDDCRGQGVAGALCSARGDRPRDPHQHAPGSDGVHFAQDFCRHRRTGCEPPRRIRLSAGAGRGGRSAQPWRPAALSQRRGGRWGHDSRKARGRHYRDGGQSLGRGLRASARSARGQHRAHAGRPEGAQRLDGWTRRARNPELRRTRLQHELRAGARSRRQRAARTGAQEMRFAGFHSHDGQRRIAQRLGRRRHRDVRSPAATPGAASSRSPSAGGRRGHRRGKAE